MSKSKGNIIDPQVIIKEDGAEALRIWSALEGDLSKQDFACSREKIKTESKTLNKLWNVSKFVFQFKEVKKPKKIFETDQLFLDYIEYLTQFCDEHYENYNFNLPAVKLRNFLWEIFASHYLELVKARAYNQENRFSKEEQDSAIWTLRFILERFLVLIYPVIPMISSEIYKAFRKDLLNEEFPKYKKTNERSLEKINKIVEFDSEIWKKKKKQNLSLRTEISGVKIPKELKDFERDLKECHCLR